MTPRATIGATTCLAALLLCLTPLRAAAECAARPQNVPPPPPECVGDGPLVESFRAAFEDRERWCVCIKTCNDPIENFAAWHGRRAVPFLQDIVNRCLTAESIMDDVHGAVLHAAIEGLGAIGDPAARPTLEAVLHFELSTKSPPSRLSRGVFDLKVKALYALTGLGSDGPSASLAASLLSVSDPNVLGEMSRLLVDDPDWRARSALQKVVQQGSPAQQEVARRTLHRIDVPGECPLNISSRQKPGEPMSCLYSAAWSKPTTLQAMECPPFAPCEPVPLMERATWTVRRMMDRAGCPGASDPLKHAVKAD